MIPAIRLTFFHLDYYIQNSRYLQTRSGSYVELLFF